jgi:hypothetical protein
LRHLFYLFALTHYWLPGGRRSHVLSRAQVACSEIEQVPAAIREGLTLRRIGEAVRPIA